MSHSPAEQELSHPIDPAVAAALDRLLPGHEGEFPVGDRPFLVRLPHAGQQLRVRRWPYNTTSHRVRFVHALLRHLADQAPGIASTPCPIDGAAAWTEIDGSFVDVELWISGQAAGGRSTPQLPDGHALHRPVALDEELPTRLVRRIAELHRLTEPLARTQDVPVAGIARVTETINRAWGDWRVRLRPVAPTYPPVQRWLRMGEQILPAALESLTGSELDHQPPVINHANLWPAHALADDTTIRLLDLDSAVAATPLLDLAQLVTRFGGWTGEHAETVIADYAGARQLAPDERRLLPAMAALDLIVEAARLLHYGYSGAIPYASREAGAARKGALDLLNSLEAVQPAVVRSVQRVPFARQRQLARIASGLTTSSGPRRPSPAKPAGGKRRRPSE